jgi:uncharacterized protein YhdP
MLRNLRGTIDVAAVNGRIDYAKGLTRVLEFLNVTEVFRGKFQDMRKEGLGYNSLTVKAHFGKGKLVIDESSLDGVTMDMAANGSFDIDRREIDAVLLVSPIKTGNVVVRAIPIIRDIFGGTLVTIPVKVTGSLDDPQVTYHPVKEVGAGLAGLMKRTLQAPFKLINPDKPGSGEEQTVN